MVNEDLMKDIPDWMKDMLNKNPNIMELVSNALSVRRYFQLGCESAMNPTKEISPELEKYLYPELEAWKNVCFVLSYVDIMSLRKDKSVKEESKSELGERLAVLKEILKALDKREVM